MKVNIITDTTATLPKEYIEKENINVFPIYYTFEDEVYKEPSPGEFDVYYKKLIESTSFPTTTQPPIGEIISTYTKALEDNPDLVIVMPISEKLSGTYNSCVLAKDIIKDDRIHVLNTRTTTLNLKRLVEYLVAIRELKLSTEEILKRLELFRRFQEVYFIPDTLEYLKRGGRISAISATIGNVLSIKPIISLLEDGSLSLIDKIRGYNKAVLKMESFIPDNVQYISIAYVYNIDKSQKLCEKLKDTYPNIDIKLEEVSPAIGSHIGPGTVGILFGTYLDLSN